MQQYETCWKHEKQLANKNMARAMCKLHIWYLIWRASLPKSNKQEETGIIRAQVHTGYMKSREYVKNEKMKFMVLRTIRLSKKDHLHSCRVLSLRREIGTGNNECLTDSRRKGTHQGMMRGSPSLRPLGRCDDLFCSQQKLLSARSV